MSCRASNSELTRHSERSIRLDFRDTYYDNFLFPAVRFNRVTDSPASTRIQLQECVLAAPNRPDTTDDRAAQSYNRTSHNKSL